MYVSTVRKSVFSDILVPRTPGFTHRGPQDPKQKFVHILNFNSKGFNQIASYPYLTCILNINDRVDVNQDGPSLIIEDPRAP